ncbi:MAG: BspA family leucine-rich repeat surface protein [Clostridia bacterium]|nr:BspA family leucine-rich repeat surface protein [Clostridia bacterium]
MKKYGLLLFLLLLITALCILPAAASGAGETSPEEWSYTLDEEEGAIILSKYSGEADTLTVPGSFELEGKTYRTVLAATTVFRGNTKLKSVTLGEGVGFLNNSMRLLFGECSSLTHVDLSAIDSSGINNMTYVFYGCSALRSLDVSSLDTSKVISMRGMFSLCSRLSGLTGYENWDTGSLLCMYQTFNKFAYDVSSSTQVTIDLRNWDLDQVNNTGWCFQMCRAQKILLPDNLAVMSAGFLNHAVRYDDSVFTVPAGVRKIGYAHTIYDFSDDRFTEFRVADGNTAYKAVDGVLYSADGTEMLAVPRGKTFPDGTFELPEGVSFLGELSFSRNYNIHTLVLPDSYEIEYVPVYDERYIVFEDTGNLNSGTNLSIAIYCYTGITDYAVKDSNPRYASADGVIYSKDMSAVTAVPARYARALCVPEGVVRWEREAMWADGSSTVDNLLKNCPGVSLPSTLTYISPDQLEMLNRLRLNRAGTDNPFTITLAEGNPAFRLDGDGYLRTVLSLTSQPEDFNAPLNGTASTFLTAEGEGLTYQWYGRDPGQTDFWKSGIRKSRYSVRMVRGKIGREVYCVVTDKYGNAVTSRVAVLGVVYPDGYEPPVITRQPQDVCVPLNGLAVTDFEATGVGLTCQWYLKNPGKETWARSSLKGTVYHVPLTRAKSGREVYCVVTDAYGNTAVTEPATLRLAPPAGYELRFTVQPEDAAADIGGIVTVKASAEGDGLKYQWYIRSAGSAKWSRSSIKTDVYSVEMTKSRMGRELYCVVTDAYGGRIESRHAFLLCDYPENYAPPRIVSEPCDVVAGRGKLAVTSFASEGEGLTYQWYFRADESSAWSVSSLKGDTYSVKMVPSKSGRQVKCVVTDKYGAKTETRVATLLMS